MATITINVNDSKFTAEAWQGFIELHPVPLDDQGQPTVATSTQQEKLDYVTSVLKTKLAHDVRRGMDIRARRLAAEAADPAFDVTT